MSFFLLRNCVLRNDDSTNNIMNSNQSSSNQFPWFPLWWWCGGSGVSMSQRLPVSTCRLLHNQKCSRHWLQNQLFSRLFNQKRANHHFVCRTLLNFVHLFCLPVFSSQTSTPVVNCVSSKELRSLSIADELKSSRMALSKISSFNWYE